MLGSAARTARAYRLCAAEDQSQWDFDHCIATGETVRSAGFVALNRGLGQGFHALERTDLMMQLKNRPIGELSAGASGACFWLVAVLG